MCGLLNNDISDDLEFSSVLFFAYCQFFSDAIGYTRDLCSVAEFLANISCDIVFTRHFALCSFIHEIHLLTLPLSLTCVISCSLISHILQLGRSAIDTDS